MPKLPSQKKIWFSDFELPDWAKRFADSVNSFMQTTTEMLNGRLEIGDNVVLKYIEIQINGDNPVVTISNPLQRPVKGLFVVQILEGIPIAAISVAQWVEVDKRITISIQGLDSSIDYRLRLVVT